MQLRLPLRIILILLWAFLLKGRAASICHSSKQARDDDDSDDDDDDDDDDDSSSQHHRACSTTVAQHGISKGGVAGIVIGCLLLLVLFILLGCVFVRRRRKPQQQVGTAAVAPAAAASSMRERTLNGQHPFAPPPTSMGTRPLVDTVLAAAPSSGNMERPQTRELANIPPIAESSESIPLPNPYEQDIPPRPPPRDRTSAPPPSSVSRYASLYSTASTTSPNPYSAHSRSYSYSGAPSAWTHDDSAAPLLSRGTTQASRLTTSSSLHEELAGYQKALEAHHRKEEDDAQQREERIGEGSVIPDEPPPVYRGRDQPV
ncbi:hypothetical protein BV20DRAFT_1051894 [Pilatotrama ljubarskyi]|nr:hypothetical protein BV20DRAFT_1051894 [Pilatotrama ljubarskyi]